VRSVLGPRSCPCLHAFGLRCFGPRFCEPRPARGLAANRQTAWELDRARLRVFERGLLHPVGGGGLERNGPARGRAGGRWRYCYLYMFVIFFPSAPPLCSIGLAMCCCMLHEKKKARTQLGRYCSLNRPCPTTSPAIDGIPSSDRRHGRTCGSDGITLEHNKIRVEST
jgi:hypothetical protein